jgi:hypothetical protein
MNHDGFLDVYMFCMLNVLYIYTLKPRYNDPFNNKIPAIKELICSPSVVNSMIPVKKTQGITKSQARRNYDVISFQSDMGTNQSTDQPTDQPT